MDSLTTLLRLDPFSPALPALCALMALALAAVIGGGFALLALAERASGMRTATAAPRELGLVALWQLGRGARSPVPRSGPAGAATRRPYPSHPTCPAVPSAARGDLQ